MQIKMSESSQFTDISPVGNKADACEIQENESDSHVEKLSKRQQKKLKKTEKWLATKQQKRKDERQRKKEKRKLAREKGIELGPSRKSLKHNTMAGSSCKIKVVVDCSFDDLMNDKDIGNVVKQLNHCYAANRRGENPLQCFVTSIEKKLKSRLDSQDDTKYWDIHLENKSFEELFTKQQIVYLSSDSDNILTTLDEDHVYVIGGLVDHNHHKGLCQRFAEEKNLYHARLPISDYVQFHSRKVLTINQVFEILLGYTETQSWEKAFLKTLPKRKGATTVASSPKQTNTDETEKQSVDDSCHNGNGEETHNVQCSRTKDEFASVANAEGDKVEECSNVGDTLEANCGNLNCVNSRDSVLNSRPNDV